MGRGIIQIDTRLLPGLLKLTEDYKAVSAWCNERGEVINVIVDHPDIPEVEEAEPFPTLQIHYESKNISVAEVKEVKIHRCIQSNETIEETMARFGIRKRGE